MRRTAWGVLFAIICLTGIAVAEAQPLLLRHPSIGPEQLVFAYGGDLWTSARNGGVAHPLTTGPGYKTDPFISPDGKLIAFTEKYDGNFDVYVMPAGGGPTRRLTFHPARDEAMGWTPDSQYILFRSMRNSSTRGTNRLFVVSVNGGLPRELPLPEAEHGSFSPDGKHIAYVPFWVWRPGLAWKRYRGGRTARIWIARLSDSSIEKIPQQDNSNDFDPLWIGNQIYFLSDRDRLVTLFSYDINTKQVKQVLPATGDDIKWATAGKDAIVYEKLGRLYTYDLATRNTAEIKVAVAGDLPNLRPHFQKVAERITNADLSPTGARAVFEARGDIFTVPGDKGDVRNLTGTPGVAERDPAWSPDGKWIAYFSDEGGEYALHLRSQDGTEVKKTALGDPPSFFYSPRWSPDSKKIAYTDKRLNLWYLTLADGKPVKVDTDYYEAPFRTLDPSWSPDSQWIAYTRRLPSNLRAAFIYSLETGKTYQVTDGMSDAANAIFDSSGKYLYFTASTDAIPQVAWFNLSSVGRTMSRNVYVIVLRKDLPSPLAPLSDDEKIAEEKPADAKDEKKDQKKTEAKPPVKVTVDFEDIDQRTLALPIPAGNYIGMEAAPGGMLYLGELPQVRRPGPNPGATIHRFELEARKVKKLLDGVTQFIVSADGKKMLYRTGQGEKAKWMIAKTPPASAPGEPEGPEPPKVQGQPLRADEMQAYVDPKAEWKQMYNEVWRIQRDFFYDPNLHGLSLQSARKQYDPYVEALASREDLDYLFHDMLGEMTVGHMYINGPPGPRPDQPRTGLLGADYSIENGRYRFLKIYRGENWNPGLRAPLTEPGVNVREGEYLLAVNGRDLQGSDNIFELFVGTAGKATVLKVAADPAGKDARSVTVVPVDTEMNLRNRAWIDANRRKVDELSGGRLAYIYVPDTSVDGYTSFNRYYMAQSHKEGAVGDLRRQREFQIAVVGQPG
ncbi:MAG: PDZ domain-containing protein, partial [Terriglobales bacterium]